LDSQWDRCGSLAPAPSTSELLMTFSRYKSVRRVLKTTLLLVGLSFALSPKIQAQESAAIQEVPDCEIKPFYEIEQARLVRKPESSNRRGRADYLAPSRYMISALVGTVTGFGVGNYMNGTPNRGRFYMAVDSASLVVMAASIASMESPPDPSAAVWFFGAGSLIFVSRVVQIGDVWFEPLYSGRVGAESQKSTRNYALIPAISENGNGLKFVGRF
jgi:hypothetical protein